MYGFSRFERLVFRIKFFLVFFASFLFYKTKVKEDMATILK